MPWNFSVRKTPSAVASRVARTANTVNSSGHERPQPRLAVFFLGRRFVDIQVLLRRQFGRQLLIRRSQRFGHLVLDLHGQRRATRLAQQRAEELGRPPLALTIVGHQQRGERHQPRPRLALRHARGQFRTACFSTARARQPMPLVLGHVRLDLGHFPDLMPQRLRVAARELRAAASALGRLESLHVVAFVGWNQRSFVLFVAGLAAAFLFGFSLRRLRPGVRMLRAGRQRGVLRRLALHLPLQRLDPRFQFRVVRQQRTNDGLGFRRLASNDFFTDSRRHATVVAECRPPCPGQFIENRVPGCERLPWTAASDAARSCIRCTPSRRMAFPWAQSPRTFGPDRMSRPCRPRSVMLDARRCRSNRRKASVGSTCCGVARSLPAKCRARN